MVTRPVVLDNNRDLDRVGSRCGVVYVAREWFTQLTGFVPSETVEMLVFSRDTLEDMTGPAMNKSEMKISRFLLQIKVSTFASACLDVIFLFLSIKPEFPLIRRLVWMFSEKLL